MSGKDKTQDDDKAPAKKKGKNWHVQRRRDRDEAKALELHVKGLAQKDIAKVLQVNIKTVRRWLSKYESFLEALEELETYRARKVDFVDAAQVRVLRSMIREELLENANLSQHSTALKTLNDVSRLESGRATAIQQSQSMRFTRVDVSHTKKDETPTDQQEEQDPNSPVILPTYEPAPAPQDQDGTGPDPQDD